MELDTDNDSEWVSVFEINCRNYMSSFDFPSVEAVISQLDVLTCEYVVESLQRHKTGIFHVHVERDVNVNDLPVLKFKKRTRFSSEIVEVEVPSTKVPTNPGRRKGTLITILKCALTREHKKLENKLFDDAFKDIGSLEKQTCYQFYRETSNLNGNRYLVVNVDDLKKIPSSITINEFTFYTRFKGQTWKCGRCWKEHVGGCPEIKAFYEAREKRKELEIKSQLVSDSTLRLVEQVGLKADVLCVPGGGLGDLANAIVDQNSEKEQLVVIGGINDVVNANLNTNSEFAFVVDKGLEKLDFITKENEKCSLTLISPVVPFEGLQSVVQEDRYSLLIERLKHYSEANPKLKLAHLDLGSIKFHDALHPDEEGSEDVLRQLHKMCGDLIWNEDHLLHSKHYGGVEKAQRWGCKACWAEGLFPLGLCDKCSTAMANYDPAYLTQMNDPKKRPLSPESRRVERQDKPSKGQNV